MKFYIITIRKIELKSWGALKNETSYFEVNLENYDIYNKKEKILSKFVLIFRDPEDTSQYKTYCNYQYYIYVYIYILYF